MECKCWSDWIGGSSWKVLVATDVFIEEGVGGPLTWPNARCSSDIENRVRSERFDTEFEVAGK